MIQCFATQFGGFDKNAQVLDQLRLAGEIINLFGPYRILKLLIGRSQISRSLFRFVFGIQVQNY
jgi:hypothetical protein